MCQSDLSKGQNYTLTKKVKLQLGFLLQVGFSVCRRVGNMWASISPCLDAPVLHGWRVARCWTWFLLSHVALVSFLLSHAAEFESSRVPFGVGQMEMTNGVTPILRLEWADPGSLLSVHPSAQAVSVHQGCNMQGDAGPPGRASWSPHPELVGSDHPLGVFTEHQVIQEVPWIETRIIIMKSKWNHNIKETANKDFLSSTVELAI